MDGKKEDSILVALLLTLTGGFLDAYTFMLRGGTFANAQTGNIVMTGVNLAKGNAGDAITNVCAISNLKDLLHGKDLFYCLKQSHWS